ncbi:IS110 family RNA-guided transposase [Streptomyces yaizuensis]|uniref:IS110 family transposase n=1 Tax=Streptomyces yaizuensis TaxID=2989713 RepID=A0AA86J3M6_9ACTN|nr:IS110 family transposase [Streptomyces sp. YSPA8]BDT39477.1 IS110 family transposase [Streptomyces sp. YSPA8]
MATVYAGIDWSDGWLDCAVVHRDGTRLGHCRITRAGNTDPVGEYLAFLQRHSRLWRGVPTAIEDPSLLIVEDMLARGMTVVHVDATLAARTRKAQSPGGERKNDVEDAYLLAGMLRGGAFRPLALASPEVRAIRVLAHAQAAAVATRSRTLNRLRTVLTAYHPAAVTAWGKRGLRHREARAVLAVASSPGAAAALSRAQFAAALRAGGRWRTVVDEAERLCLLFLRSRGLRVHPVVEAAREVEMLSVLDELTQACVRADGLAERVSVLFGRHPYYPVLVSFPGVGDTMGARILGEIGDIGRFTVRGLCAYAGVTPVTWSSGTMRRDSLRRAVNGHLRRALTQAAMTSLLHSPGAAAYYRARRERGCAHFTSLRAVGARMARCLHHCLTHGEAYDEEAAWGPAGR